MYQEKAMVTGCIIVLVLAATVSTELEPAAKSLRYVIAIFRHGIRSPMESSALPNDPNKEKYLELAGGRLASLSKMGKQQMFGVGKSLKLRYGSFINGYQKDKVTVSTTKTSRTIMSALTVMAAMFTPSPEIFRNLPWQPTTVRQNIDNMEKAYLFMYRRPSDCPKYSELSSDSSSKFNSPDDRQRHQRLYDVVGQYAGQSNINTPAQLYNIYDTLYFSQRNGLQLPAWSTTPLKEFDNRPIYPDLLKPFLEEFFQSVMYHQRNEEMLKLFSGPMLNWISSKFVKLSTNPKAPGRFWYHSTHDTTIYPLLRGLRVDDPLTAEPGDGVLLELHVEGKEKYVKMHMYSSSKREITELHSPLCPSPCTLDRFSVNLKGLTPRQWDEFCQK